MPLKGPIRGYAIHVAQVYKQNCARNSPRKLRIYKMDFKIEGSYCAQLYVEAPFR